MRTTILALAVLAGASAAHAEATCAPTSLVKIVTTNITPGIKPGTFAAAPLVMYRSGSLLMRTEEAPDPAQRLHLLTVLHAPDVWFVNLADRTGKHIVDPGPSIDVHAPIFAGGAAVSPEISALEFGCEAEFARTRMGKPEAQEGKVAVYRLRHGQELLELKLAADGRPTQAGYYLGGEPKLLIRYDEYVGALPPNAALFAKPDGIAYAEEPPGG
jgi:hypothetical protein